MFVILRQDETHWVEKAEFLRDRGGLGLINTHPDYLVDRRILRAYARFLDRFAEDETAWKALPCEVSAWWRRRAASSLERDGDTWRIARAGGRRRTNRVRWGILVNEYCATALDYLRLAYDGERALFSYSTSLDEGGGGK